MFMYVRKVGFNTFTGKKTGLPLHEHVDDKLAIWGRPELALAIQDKGYDAVFTRGADSVDLAANSAIILRPTIDRIGDAYSVTVKPTKISLSGISAFRNVAKPLSTEIEALPELNHPRVRATAKDKALSNELAAQWSKKYTTIDSDDPSKALDALSSDTVVLKPRNGMKSEGLHIGTKEQIAQIITSNDFDKNNAWILEEKLDFSPKIPLLGRTPNDQELIDRANRLGAPKELRVYTFGRNTDGSLISNCVLRTVTGEEIALGNDRWVFVDPDSVPQEVLDASSEIAANFETHTGVKEMHLGIDWVYAREFGESEPRWINMEVNGTQPQLIYHSENAEVSKEQVNYLAEQLGRVAEHGQ